VPWLDVINASLIPNNRGPGDNRDPGKYDSITIIYNPAAPSISKINS